MITLKNVSKWYGHFQVLTDCSTEVKKGEVVVVCGPSGSGKSTLIKTVNGLEPVQQGEITVDGTRVNDKKTNLAKLRSRVGMVFQHFELFPHLSIIENLTLAQVKVLNRDKAASRAKGLKLLERVGSPPMPINTRPSSPAASSSAWRSPARCVWIRLRCCLTNRLPRWIRK
jgi:glutamate/aspartate transport system ATP-binding protein